MLKEKCLEKVRQHALSKTLRILLHLVFFIIPSSVCIHKLIKFSAVSSVKETIGCEDVVIPVLN
jgi:hypothetical protein